MPQFPQLVEEDFKQIDAFLKELLVKSEATIALFVEKAGYLITQCGDHAQFNTTEIATLASNAFNATQFMADRVGESNFSSMFQQGEKLSVLWANIDENSLLVVVFPASHSVGAIKFYAQATAQLVAAQLLIAQEREPGGGIDLATLDPEDVSFVFKRKSTSTAEEAPAAPVPDPPQESAPPAAEAAAPVICQKGPYYKTVEPGTYLWCACGRSMTQPFCDGSHAGTGISPVSIDITSTQKVAFCGCKCTQSPPFCDGTHSQLP